MSIVQKLFNKTHLSLRHAFQLILASIDALFFGQGVFYGMTKGTLRFLYFNNMCPVQTAM
jgi:hypothetical protein